MGLLKKEERNYAQMLYVNERLTFKEVAGRVGVGEKTVSRWAKDGAWEQLRKSLLTTKQKQITLLYDQLSALNEKIETSETKYPDPKEADTLAKITTSIQRLETETSIGQIVEVARNFIDFIREFDLEFAKEVTKHFDMYVLSKMK